MATEETRTRNTQALVIFDERGLGCAMTATSQAGPHPGVPEPDQVTSAVLEASGDYDDEPLDDVEIIAVEAGSVGTGTFRWRYPPAGDAFAHDPPMAISGFQFVDRSTTSGYWRHPSGCRLPSGLAVIAATQESTIASAAVEIAPGEWTLEEIEDTGDDTRTACCVREDGPAGPRVLLYYTVDVTGDGDDATQIRMVYSDDAGSTWTTGSRAALVDPFGHPASWIHRIRVVYFAGQVLLLIWADDGTDDRLYQYVSGDGGATFALVEVTSETAEACPDVKAWGGSLYVVTVYDDGVDILPYVRVLGAPGLPLSSVERVLATTDPDAAAWGSRSGNLITAELALLVDDDGRLWLYGSDFDSDHVTISRVSTDAGVTWETPYRDTPIHRTGDASTYLRDLAVVAERGRAALACTYVGAPSTADASLLVAWLGGWATVGMPEWSGGAQPVGVIGWEVAYLPLDLPEDTGTAWSVSTAGAPTYVIGPNGLSVTAAAGEHVTWISYITATGDESGILLTATSDLSGFDSETWLVLQWSDGVNGYAARVKLTISDVTLEDLVGAGTTTEAATLSGGVELRFALVPGSGFAGDTGRAAVSVASSGGSVRDFTIQLSLTGLERDALTECVAQVSAREGTQDLAWWGYVSGEEIGGDADDDPARGRLWCGRPSPAHVVGGLCLALVDGPAWSGDTWQVATAYDYPVEAIDPSIAPSPSRRWRSTVDDQQDIVITSDVGWRAGDLVAFVVMGANFRDASIYADDGAVTKIADVDMAGGQEGLCYVRSRNLLRPAADAGASSADFLWHEGALAGARASFGGVVRPIATNWEGAWLNTDPANYHAARVVLDSYANADSAAGTDLEVWYPGLVVVTTLLESTDTLMLRIPAAVTAEGYFELGLFAVGRIAVFAHDYDHNRERGIVSGTDLTTMRGGGRSAQRRHRPRRQVDISWDDGIPTTGAHTPGSAPMFIRSGSHVGAAPVAARAETPDLVAGLFDAASGSYRPCVYIASLARLSVAPTTTAPGYILDPSRWIYGRITSEEVRLATVRGDEHSATRPERVRITTLRIEEEL